jgi:hypothetical protein
MQRNGLTLDQYANLKMKPPAGAAPAFVEAAEMELAEMFPMALSGRTTGTQLVFCTCRAR